MSDHQIDGIDDWSGLHVRPSRVHEGERLRRWRMVLGAGEPDSPDGTGIDLDGHDKQMDACLSALYDAPPTSGQRGRSAKRSGGLGSSAPNIARWLGDIRTYFPTGVVQVMQRDAIDRLNLQRMLLEPEMLAAIEPDVHLVATLLALQHLLPETTRATARMVVGRVVDALQQRLAEPTMQAVRGALARSSRTRRPLPSDIDWDRTIHANLAHYQPDLKTVIPNRLVGYARQEVSLIANPFDPNSNSTSGGVSSGPITSSRDAFVEAAVWKTQHRGGYADGLSTKLTEIERTFPLTAGSGIPGEMDKFFATVSQWSVSPNDSVARRNVLDRAASLAQKFNQAAVDLGDSAGRAGAELGITVQKINRLTAEIASINGQRRENLTRTNDAGLDSTLHAKLEELSQFVDFTALPQEDGSVSVFIGGQTAAVIGDHKGPISIANAG